MAETRCPSCGSQFDTAGPMGHVCVKTYESEPLDLKNVLDFQLVDFHVACRATIAEQAKEIAALKERLDAVLSISFCTKCGWMGAPDLFATFPKTQWSCGNKKCGYLVTPPTQAVIEQQKQQLAAKDEEIARLREIVERQLTNTRRYMKAAAVELMKPTFFGERYADRVKAIVDVFLTEGNEALADARLRAELERTVVRGLSEVLARIITELPEAEAALKGDLTKLRDSTLYTAPEMMRSRWFEAQSLLGNRVAELMGDKATPFPEWPDKVRRIFNDEEKADELEGRKA